MNESLDIHESLENQNLEISQQKKQTKHRVNVPIVVVVPIVVLLL